MMEIDQKFQQSVTKRHTARILNYSSHRVGTVCYCQNCKKNFLIDEESSGDKLYQFCPRCGTEILIWEIKNSLLG